MYCTIFLYYLLIVWCLKQWVYLTFWHNICLRSAWAPSRYITFHPCSKCQMFESWRCVWSAWIQQGTDLMLHAKTKRKMIVLKKCEQDIQLLFCTFDWALTTSCADPAGMPKLYRKVGALRRTKRAYLAYLKTRFHLCKCSELEPAFEFAVACTKLFSMPRWVSFVCTL